MVVVEFGTPVVLVEDDTTGTVVVVVVLVLVDDETAGIVVVEPGVTSGADDAPAPEHPATIRAVRTATRLRIDLRAIRCRRLPRPADPPE